MLIRVVVFLLFVVIFVAIGLVAMAASSKFQLASELSDPVTCVPDQETKDKIKAIMLAATEEALREHVIRLHESWMKDDTGQPARAINGVSRGIKAFIAGRARAMRWNPPICP